MRLTVIAAGLLIFFGMPNGSRGAAETRPHGAVAQEISFAGAGGTRIVGTFLLPAGAGESRVPALVLIAGSGPTDRDGNQPPGMVTNLMKQIAERMAEKGIASLRFDKRGMYASAAGLPKDPKEYGEFFTWENFRDDVISAYQFVQDRPEIDGARVGILGHSEGGLLALSAVEVLTPKREAPSVLILLSTPGRTMDAVITDQLTSLLRQQKANAQQRKYLLDTNARITEAVRERGQVPADVPPGLAALYPAYLGEFLHSELALDPCKSVAQFSGPVLVMAGEKDTQVSPKKDAEALDAALKTRRNDDHEMAVIPGASHNLKIVKADSNAGMKGEVAPVALTALEKWAVEKLKAAEPKRPTP